MRNDYVREDGQWPPESVPTARDWALFDRAQARGLRVDANGGTYAPANPIVIGGTGLVLSGAAQHIVGDVRTESAGRLRLGDDDYPVLSPSRTKVRLVPFGIHASGVVGLNDTSFEVLHEPFGLRFTTKSSSAAREVIWAIPAQELHDGATLSSVVVRFRVGAPHSAVPATRPSIAMARFGVGGVSAGIGGLLYSAFGAEVTPVPTTGDGYYAGGAVQTITMPCDQNNAIDAGIYTYVVLLIDESGAGSVPGNIWHSIELHFTNITDLRPE